MQDIYKKFPYNQNNYRQNFIALDVLEEIYKLVQKGGYNDMITIKYK